MAAESSDEGCGWKTIAVSRMGGPDQAAVAGGPPEVRCYCVCRAIEAAASETSAHAPESRAGLFNGDVNPALGDARARS